MNGHTEKKIRIALLAGSLSASGGGAPRSIAIHARALQIQGAEVTIFTGYNKKCPLTPEQFQLKCEVVSSKLWGPSVLCLAVRSLLRLYRHAQDFDIIHLNGSWNLMSFIASRIAYYRNVPYVFSCRGHLGEHDFTRYYAIKPFLYMFLERRNIRDAMCVHVCSRWEKESSMRALQPAKMVVEIPNAVDLSEFTPAITRNDARKSVGVSSNEFMVVFFGRVERVKNPQFLLEAFAKAELPENAKLYFIGPPVRKLKSALLKDIKTYKLNNRVVFVDFAGGKKRQAWLSSANLFALPSADDSFSVAVIEAASAGTHCLLSPYVGAEEFLPRDMVTVCELKVDVWVETLRKLYSNPPPQQVPSSDFTAQFSLEMIGKQWLEVYTDILKKTSGMKG